MKKINIHIMAALFLLMGSAATFAQTPPTNPPAQQGPLKVGYTNIEIVLSYYPDALAVEKELQTFVSQQERIIEIKMKYYQTEVQLYQERTQNNTWASEADKKAMEVKLGNLEQEIQATEDNAEQELGVKRNKLLDPVTTKIQKAVDEVAAEHGFTYILNQTLGGGIPSIIFGLEQYDCTDLIAAKLGVTIPKAGPK